MLDVVRRTAEACFMPLTVGGGVRTLDDIRKLLRLGRGQGLHQHRGGCAPRWCGKRRKNSATNASSSPLMQRKYRPRGNRSVGRSSLTAGAIRPGSMRFTTRANGRARRRRDLLTSMDRDGTRQGFDIALTRAVADAVRMPVIASGGVGTLEHLVEGIRDGHSTAVLAASIFHFGEYSIREAKTYMAAKGLPMRLDP